MVGVAALEAAAGQAVKAHHQLVGPAARQPVLADDTGERRDVLGMVVEMPDHAHRVIMAAAEQTLWMHSSASPRLRGED